MVAAALPVGCGTGAVEVERAPLSGADAEACAAFTEALPQSLLGLERRETEPGDAAAAAWGSPPVVVTCGVGPAEGFDRYSSCIVADGIGWYAPDAASEDLGSAVTLTTVTVAPRVRLEIPAEHRPPAGLLSELAPLVRRHLRETEPCV